MALLERNSKATTQNDYMALLDENGEMIAIINPMKDVPRGLLMEALASKGIKAEIRESKADRVAVKL